MSKTVFVLDTHKNPLAPCKPFIARKLLNAGKAAVYCQVPFTIILKKAVAATLEPPIEDLDPGSKTMDIAVPQNDTVV